MSDPREEAERLIATVLGGASVAAEGLRNFATGSPECCACPICRAIAATRDPSPELAERLANGAGELAVGLASVLRAFAGSATARPADRPAAPKAEPAAEGDPWRAATRGEGPPPAPAQPPRPMAKKAVKPKQAAPDPASGSDGASDAQEEQ